MSNKKKFMDLCESNNQLITVYHIKVCGESYITKIMVL